MTTAKESLEDENLYLEGVIKSLKEQLGQKNEEVRNALKGSQSSDREEKLEAEVEKLRQKHRSLEREVGALQDRLEEKMEENKKMNEALPSDKDNELQRRIGDLEAELHEKRRELKLKADDLRMEKIASDDLEFARDRLQHEVQSLREKVKELESSTKIREREVVLSGSKSDTASVSVPLCQT